MTTSDWDFSIILSLILGPSFKYGITDNFEIFAGGGLHLGNRYEVSGNYRTDAFFVGIGGDLGIRYKPIEKLYISAGCLLVHDFFYAGELSIGNYRKEYSGSINLGSYTPYLGIGYIFN